MYHCVVNNKNEVINVVLWDGQNLWHPGEGLRAIACLDRSGSIGDIYDPVTNTYRPKP